MAVNPDFKDLFAALNAAEARYLVVGAHAVGFHARPRFTKDLDIWVEPAPDNAARVLAALSSFGAPVAELTAEDLTDPRTVFQIGVAPNRVDILTALEGLEFADAWEHRVDARYGETPIHVLGKDDLIRNKRAVGRPTDLDDVRALEGS